MNINEKVSIIISVYNVENYLRRCIDSLLAQSYQNIEILMIDDCSSDNSGNIAKEYSQKYPDRCVYIKQAQNKGAASARNTGIEKSQGEWLSFVDSDDWVHQDFIKEMLEAAINTQADFVVCDLFYSYNNGTHKEANTLSTLTAVSSHKDKVAFLRNHACTRLIRKSFFIQSGLRFPEDIRRGEDIAVMVPLMTKTNKIGILNKALYYYYQRENSVSNKNTDIDLSFYPKVIALIRENSDNGFETELEYHYIQELMYGMNMLMIKDHRTTKEIKKNIKDFTRQYPNWKNNPYLKNCNRFKRLFIKAAGSCRIGLMRLMVKGSSLLQ